MYNPVIRPGFRAHREIDESDRLNEMNKNPYIGRQSQPDSLDQSVH